MKDLDVLVTGLPRSGTTLVANLMTNPSLESWCIVEPLTSAMPKCKGRVTLQAADFDIQIPSINIHHIMFALSELRMVGIKEVLPARRNWVSQSMHPRETIIVVRDLRDIIVSWMTFNMSTTKRPDKVVELFENRCDDLLRFQSLVGGQIVRYEDLLTEQGRDDTGLDLDGDPNRWLDMYQRADEKREGIVSRGKERLRKEHSLLINRVLRKCNAYQEVFKYV